MASGSTHEEEVDDGSEGMEYTHAEPAPVYQVTSQHHGEHEWGAEEEEENEYEDDVYSDDWEEEEDDHDDIELHPPEHYLCPIHQHMTDYTSYPDDPQAYLSDGPDMSDGPAAPLVEAFITNLLAEGFAIGASSGAGSATGLSSPEDGPGPGPEPPTDQPAQPATALPQTFIPPPEPNPPGPLPVIDFALGPVNVQLPAFGVAHPVPFTGPNGPGIGPSNFGLVDFLRHWAHQSRALQGLARGRSPWPSSVNSLETYQPKEKEPIVYDKLQGDAYDFQGVNWDDLGVTRRDARERRLLTYTNYVNIPGSDKWNPNLPDRVLPRTDSFFRFRDMHIIHKVHLSHFQLRHVFAGTSRSRVFYPTVSAVQQFNPMSGASRPILKFRDTSPTQISTLTAGHGVLVAGGFNGEYFLRRLDTADPDSPTACHEGTITTSASGITNHATIYVPRTSSSPVVAFASNDNSFRTLDLTTEKWLAAESFDFAPNCTALSPDGRLRVLVGDSLDVIITASSSTKGGDNPEIIHRLPGHRDYGFACDWADDGYSIATAFQDKTVKIWDARRLTDTSGNALAVHTIRSEMAGVRSVKFSPVGGGRPVLVAVEEADFVSVIDACGYRSKQTVDVFGELGRGVG
ncbi:hypothetical protein N0V88_004545 [Collariella sp. IMI 366227]|nr:hypothetical protein N0V88_004545 [Collariella sp. IMI 366227]